MHFGDYSIRVADTLAPFADNWPTMAGLPCAVGAFPFQCRDHLEVWLKTIGASTHTKPYFVEVRRRDEIVMFIPLGVAIRHGVRVLAFLDGGVSDYNAPILFPAAAALDAQTMSGLWRKIRSQAPPFDVACLEKMPQKAGPLSNPFAMLGRHAWSSSGHLLRLSRDSLQKKRDADDSNRQRRRLAKIGDLRFAIASHPDEIAHIFDVFVVQKSRRYQETLGTPGFDVPGQRDYYRQMSLGLAGRGCLLAHLNVGEEIIATAWCLTAGQVFYYMMCAYDGGEWRKYSPGRLLLEELVRWARQAGFEIFDLGIGDENYKLHWQQDCVSLSGGLYPATISGHAYVAALGLRKVARATLPSQVTAALASALYGPRKAGTRTQYGNGHKKGSASSTVLGIEGQIEG